MIAPPPVARRAGALLLEAEKVAREATPEGRRTAATGGTGEVAKDGEIRDGKEAEATGAHARTAEGGATAEILTDAPRGLKGFTPQAPLETQLPLHLLENGSLPEARAQRGS